MHTHKHTHLKPGAFWKPALGAVPPQTVLKPRHRTVHIYWLGGRSTEISQAFPHTVNRDVREELLELTIALHRRIRGLLEGHNHSARMKDPRPREREYQARYGLVLFAVRGGGVRASVEASARSSILGARIGTPSYSHRIQMHLAEGRPDELAIETWIQ